MRVKMERDVTLVALAGPFEALPQPVLVLLSQDPRPEGELWEDWGVWAAKWFLRSNEMRFFTKIVVLSDLRCWKPQYRILLLWEHKYTGYMCVRFCVLYVLYVSHAWVWYVSMHASGTDPLVEVEGNLNYTAYTTFTWYFKYCLQSSSNHSQVCTKELEWTSESSDSKPLIKDWNWELSLTSNYYTQTL